jgi:hypothetical protein
MVVSTMQNPDRPGLVIFGPYRHGLRWRFHLKERGRTSYRSFKTRQQAGAFAELHGVSVARTGLLLDAAGLVLQTKPGWIYVAVVALQQGKRHLKVGFTKDLRRRFHEFRTLNPGVALLAAWQGDRSDETRAHASLDGRIGKSEVFAMRSATAALKRLERALGPRRL